MEHDRGEQLIRAQIAYYRARAPEYDETFGGAHDPALVAALEALRPRGRVVELACGTGAWTEALVRHPIDSLLAVDAAPEMLELHAQRIKDVRVRRQVADLFRWTPAGRYDLVTFAFWLSHVPPARFAAFWETVASALAPGGTVFFVDESLRRKTFEQPSEDPNYPTVERRLSDGRAMTAIKVYYQPRRLQPRIEALGWAVHVEPAGEGFLVGEARIK